LVNTLLVDKLFAVWKLDSPGVFQLLDEVMDQDINRAMQSTHEFHKSNLADLDEHQWSALPISLVETIRTIDLDLLELLEFIVQYDVNVLLLSPNKVIFELDDRFVLVKVVTFQKPSIKVLIEQKLLDLVDQLLPDDPLDKFV